MSDRSARRYRSESSSTRRSSRDESSRRPTRRFSPEREDRSSSRRSTETKRVEKRTNENKEQATQKLPFSKSYIITLPSMITDGLLKKAGCDDTGKHYVLEIRLQKK